MKTINILTNYFPPHIAPSSNRIFSLTNVLAKNFKVRVFYNCEKGEIFEPDSSLENVEFIPVLIKSRKKNNLILRVLCETFYSFKLNLKTIRYPCDITLVSIPDLMLLPVSALFNIVFSRKSIVDVRDLIWRYAEFKKGTISSLFNSILTVLSRVSLKAFSSHVCVTKKQKEYLDPFTHCDFKVISNGIEFSKFERLEQVRHVVHDNKFVITYAGTLGHAQNLVSLLPAFKKLSDNGVFINIIGDGVQYQEVCEFVASNKLECVNVTGKVNWDTLLQYYQNTSLLFAQLRDTPAINTAEPSKLFEYYSTGKPVLYLGKGAAHDLIQNFGGTWVGEPEDPLIFSDMVLKIKENKNIYSQATKNRGAIKDNYIRECQLYEFVVCCNLL